MNEEEPWRGALCAFADRDGDAPLELAQAHAVQIDPHRGCIQSRCHPGANRARVYVGAMTVHALAVPLYHEGEHPCRARTSRPPRGAVVARPFARRAPDLRSGATSRDESSHRVLFPGP